LADTSAIFPVRSPIAVYLSVTPGYYGGCPAVPSGWHAPYL